MAYWGIALANGVSLNRPYLEVESDEIRRAIGARANLRKHRMKGSAVEQAMSDALEERLADPLAVTPAARDAAYAEAMRRVSRAYPDDPDVGAMTAESILSIRRFDYWTHDGLPRPGTREAIEILERVLKKHPRHPYALHLMIHAVEASPDPAKVKGAANLLRDLAPGLPHLLHMPSHIDMRLGLWEDAVVANEKAIVADRELRARRDDEWYNNGVVHNHHMLIYAAAMQGEEQKAMRAAREMLALVPDYVVNQTPGEVDGFFATPYEINLRFGRWDNVLNEPRPQETCSLSMALWHYSRGIALAAKGQIDQAKVEQKEFIGLKKVTPATAHFRVHLVSDLLGVADAMLAGEICYREGQMTRAFDYLREAVRKEDMLRYSEPPDWLIPSRHALGAALLQSREYRDAEEVYREDLRRRPENGWSLFGLARSLQGQGKSAEARLVSARLQKAWRHADFKLSSSCCCLPETRKASQITDAIPSD